MTDEERKAIEAEATLKANVENRLRNLEDKMKWALASAAAGAVYIGKTVLEWYINGGGPR